MALIDKAWEHTIFAFEKTVLFNTFDFFVFFIIVYICYAGLPHRLQNLFLLIASYFFYSVWDYRFLGLIFLSTTIDYTSARLIDKSKIPGTRKIYLYTSIVCNLGILGLFKYFNFFVASFTQLLDLAGFQVNSFHLEILLPVGISFYTFQSMSYTIDCYRNQIKPVKNFLDYALYVSFFPQLVAGPIERAATLLKQIQNRRVLNLSKLQNGLWLILWGLVLKVYCADNLAPIVNQVFGPNQITPINPLSVWIASYAYSFQILGDFAGYSCIAKGVASLLGFELVFNFNLPYFSRNPAEFWKRWHISLSGWLRDYLYIPLGGNRNGKWATRRNLMITMILGGLWHGANLTFLLWGFYHGMLLVIHRIFRNATTPPTKNLLIQKINDFIKILVFFHCIVFGWMIFRSPNLEFILDTFSNPGPNFYYDPNIHLKWMQSIFYFVLPVALIQLWQRLKNDLYVIQKQSVVLQALIYTLLLYLLILWGNTDARDFIYFQF